MIERYICTVIDEMRQCYKTYNFGCIQGLIEEFQTLANRMEAKLSQVAEVKNLHEQIKKLDKQREDLEIEVEELKIKKGK